MDAEERIKDYIHWLNEGAFQSKDTTVSWIDIYGEINTLYKNYKINTISTSEYDLQPIRKEVSDFMKQNGLEKTLETDTIFNEYIKVLIYNQHELTNTLIEMYTNEYLVDDIGKSTGDIQTEQKGYYAYNIRSIGFRAIYFLKQDQWTSYNLTRYFELFQKSVLHDFGTNFKVKNLIKKYKEEKDQTMKELFNTLKCKQPDNDGVGCYETDAL